MELKEILSHADHTVLSPTATWEDIAQCVDDAAEYRCAVAMIPPCFVDQAYAYAEGRVEIATVIGFPHGNSTTASKVFEAADAVSNGAAEIDMVANLSWIKEGRWNGVENDIKQVKTACGDKKLKVIIETCLLTDEEKIRMCQICSSAGADWIKTSTGFSTTGATFEDVQLLVDNSVEPLQVKAAGGISSIEDAERFLEIGATRLGTSKLVKIAKER